MTTGIRTIWIWYPCVKNDRAEDHPFFWDFDAAQKYLDGKYGGGLTFTLDNFCADVKSVDGKDMGKLHIIHRYQEEQKTINIPICDMVVTLAEPRRGETTGELPAYGTGTITSKLKDPCPLCDKNDCYRECASSLAPSGESVADCADRKTFNDRVDAMESLILACACAGVDVESLAFLEAIETAHQAIGNE